MEWILLVTAVPAAVVVGVRIADNPDRPRVPESLFSAAILGYLTLASFGALGMPTTVVVAGTVVLAATLLILASERTVVEEPKAPAPPLPQRVAELVDPASTLLAYTELGQLGVYDHEHHADAVEAARKVAAFLDDVANELGSERQPAGP